MKLLNYTSKYFLILLLPLITIWAVIFYYALLDEIYDSLDDGLENQKVLILKHLDAEDKLAQNQDFSRGNHIITRISKEEYQTFEDRYRDTLMYMQNEEDFEPVRFYESGFEKNGNYYKVKIVTSMVEEDDLIGNLATYLTILYLLMLLSIVLLNNFILRKTWQPFYSLMFQLKNFRIEKDTTLNIKKTNIEEFELLNTTMQRLTEKSRKSYLNQKHFIENASHELQTPLAISINKLELFSEDNSLTEAQTKDIGFVLDNLNRLTRLNKSLLLLSKIENQQFLEEEEVDFTKLTMDIIEDFDDLLQHKQISINWRAKQRLVHFMNKDLARVLLTNLIKNAIVHGKRNEQLSLEISSDSIVISNFSKSGELNSTDLFQRFKKLNSDNRSTGLGLAIAKAITQRYALQLLYNFSATHNFTITFPAPA